MKQASDSLLTLCLIPFKLPDPPAFPRDTAGALGRHLTPFFVHRVDSRTHSCIPPNLSCPPRSIVRSRLGEGRIRSLLRSIGFILSTVWTILGSMQLQAFAETLTVSLREEVAVRSNIITLKDIADLRGLDPDRLRGAEDVALGPAPEFGSGTVLTRGQIEERIQTKLGSHTGIVFEGPPAVQVQAQGKPVDPNEIVVELKSYFSKTTPWKASEIEIHSIGNIKGIELPSDDAELRLASNPTIVGRRKILAPIEVIRAGKSLHSFWVTAELTVHATILVASQKIPLEKIISADDIVEKVADIPDLRAVYARRPEDILGKASRRNFSPGDPLTSEAFSDPFLVHHGETVRLRLERNGILLTSLARAEQDGRLGQVIVVRNLEFSSTLKAQVTGRAAVRMQ